MKAWSRGRCRRPTLPLQPSRPRRIRVASPGHPERRASRAYRRSAPPFFAALNGFKAGLTSPALPFRDKKSSQTLRLVVDEAARARTLHVAQTCPRDPDRGLGPGSPDRGLEPGTGQRRGVSLPLRDSSESELLRPPADAGLGRDRRLDGLRDRPFPRWHCGRGSSCSSQASTWLLWRIAGRWYGPWAGF